MNKDFFKKIDLCLPENGINEDFCIPVSDYLHANQATDCQFDFSIGMTIAGEIKPAELGIDEDIGEVCLSMT